MQWPGWLEAHHRPTTFETYSAVVARAADALSDIAARACNLDPAAALVVAHSGVVRSLVRHLGGMVEQLRKGESSPSGVSSFQALAMSLSGRVGTGNVAGVATAVAVTLDVAEHRRAGDPAEVHRHAPAPDLAALAVGLFAGGEGIPQGQIVERSVRGILVSSIRGGRQGSEKEGDGKKAGCKKVFILEHTVLLASPAVIKYCVTG